MTTKLTQRQSETLRAVLDTLIPPSPEAGRPGAGELELGEAIATSLGGFAAGFLDDIDATAASTRRKTSFAQLAAGEREAMLRASPDVGVLHGLVFQTYVHYYEHPRVIESLGLEARPPFPRGYELEAGDPALLDSVRGRPRLYRDA